jgi:hypothetical protein
MSAESVHNIGAQAFVIEIGDISAGVAVRERGGFAFVATDRRFNVLDGSKFKRIQQVENAARGVWRASASR